MNYEPEKYWNDVAKRIAERYEGKFIAGDDDPFYHYKREKFLRLLREISFSDKVVLEVGPGPGGNLIEVLSLSPKELHGADISDEMLSIAKKVLHGQNVTLTKADHQLPYPDRYFDIAYTVTVLQHNTDEFMLQEVVEEICRVSKGDIFIFERIEKVVKGTSLCLGRPVSYYEQLFNRRGFKLKEKNYLNIQVSYLICGMIRKLFNKAKRKEGEKVSPTSVFLQKVVLPITRKLDTVFKANRDLAMLHFERKG